jgi:hypothetical protein
MARTGCSPPERDTAVQDTTSRERNRAALREPVADGAHDHHADLAPGKMNDMDNGRNTRFTLLRGATGFFMPKDGPLPVSDVRAFRTALYAAARVVEGRVGEFEGQEYPLTFHTASVVDRTGESVVLCHAHHPWVAFARERRNWYGEEFLPPPSWAFTFTEAGFVVLSDAQLTTPLSAVDTSVLGPEEWRQVRSYRITTLGGVLFNAWA